jgi:hypothetical protein
MVRLDGCVQEAEMSDKAEADSYLRRGIWNGGCGLAGHPLHRPPGMMASRLGGLVMRKIVPPVTGLSNFGKLGFLVIDANTGPGTATSK